MDEQIMISDIAQRQTPVLTRTSHLVRCLGMCKMYATTPEAAGIRLPMLQQDASGQVTIVSGGQGRSDLGTELDRIAQNGLDMFSEANMFLNGIRYKIGPLASPGGPVSVPRHQISSSSLTIRTLSVGHLAERLWQAGCYEQQQETAEPR